MCVILLKQFYYCSIIEAASFIRRNESDSGCVVAQSFLCTTLQHLVKVQGWVKSGLPVIQTQQEINNDKEISLLKEIQYLSVKQEIPEQR